MKKGALESFLRFSAHGDFERFAQRRRRKIFGNRIGAQSNDAFYQGGIDFDLCPIVNNGIHGDAKPIHRVRFCTCGVARFDFSTSFLWSHASDRSQGCGRLRGITHGIAVHVPPIAMESTTTTRKEAPAAKAANKPVKIFRHHGISVSVFANSVKIEGRDKTFYKVTMSKAYRDDEGNIQRTGS